MPDGLAVVDKAAGLDVPRRRGQGRAGCWHTARSATPARSTPTPPGVLLLGVGRVTRLLRFLTALPKTYTAEIVLGVETSTLDASGEVTATHDMARSTLDEVRPRRRRSPATSCRCRRWCRRVKVDGRRLHELARAGIEVEREPRPVTVHRFDVDSTPDPLVYRVEVECSSGTYVRTLAADLGQPSAAAPTCATCAAPHRLVRRGRSARSRRARAAARCGRAARHVVDVRRRGDCRCGRAWKVLTA